MTSLGSSPFFCSSPRLTHLLQHDGGRWRKNSQLDVGRREQRILHISTNRSPHICIRRLLCCDGMIRQEQALRKNSCGRVCCENIDQVLCLGKKRLRMAKLQDFNSTSCRMISQRPVGGRKSIAGPPA
jgi:hypothetical protein